MGQTDPGQVFRDAADILRRDGWRSGAPMEGETTHCLLDAVAEAKGVRHQYTELGRKDRRWSSAKIRPEALHLAGLIGEQYEFWADHAHEPHSPAYWNDMPDRTKDEVIALLEKAATSAPVDL